MEFWNDVINTALLGTEKKPLPPPAYAPQLQIVAGQINTQAGLDREEQFLQLAAVASNVRQSGSKPYHQPGLNFPQAAAESFPYCSQRAIQVLRDILGQESQPLVHLWLERCIAAKKIAPPQLLSVLFNRAVQHKDIRSAVATVVGRRGEWLSRFNPAWEFSSAVDEEQLWQTGTLDQRKAALRQMRQQDAAKAREWLAQSWDQENANTRAELLKQLDGSVEPADESFLSSAFNEKSQKVKEAALALLRQLPDGALVKTYAETAAAMITLKKEKALLGLTTKTTLSIQPAPVPEKAAQLSGIDYLAPNVNYTDEEYVLYQLIQFTPPAFWEQHLGQTPAEILDYFTGPKEKYVKAFAIATAHFKAANWARALVIQGEGQYPALLGLLPLPEREARIIQNLQKHKDSDAQIQQATQWPEEWSHNMAKEIITYTAVQPWRWTYFFNEQIARIPVSIAPYLKTVGPAEPGHVQIWTKMADQVAVLLKLKEQTQNAFNE